MFVRSKAGPKPDKNTSLDSWIWDVVSSIGGVKGAPECKGRTLPTIFTNWNSLIFKVFLALSFTN